MESKAKERKMIWLHVYIQLDIIWSFLKVQNISVFSLQVELKQVNILAI